MIGRPELCVGAVVIEDERLLLIRRGTDPGRGRWTLPGGRVEAGESMVVGVLRELREETGLEGLCGPFVGWVEGMGADYHFVVADFWVDVLDDGPLRAGSDADEVAWVAFDELVHADLVEGLADFLVDQEIVPADVFPL